MSASHPSAPRIYGTPLYRGVLSGIYKLDAGLTQIRIAASTWFVTGGGLSRHGYHSSVDEATRAIENFLRETVLSLAPLLDDAAKRELVKAAGIGLEHFPECKDEAESEAEPVL